MAAHRPPSLHTHRRSPRNGRQRQRGVVAVEFALVFLLGFLPLLMLTLSGVLIFAAKQSLTLAAAEGARAALHYGTPEERGTYACQAARHSMQWLLTFSDDGAACTTSGNGSSIKVSAPSPCDSRPTVQCMKVETSFNYNDHPFIPGTTAVYGWLLHGPIQSSAVIQLDTQGS